MCPSLLSHFAFHVDGEIQVSFAVDGTLLLASLSVVKALLEVLKCYLHTVYAQCALHTVLESLTINIPVICNIGGTVFAAILILRVIWAAVSHFQSSANSFNQGSNSFGAVA
ncbi:hypothetical protein L195_g044911 [Trifolium pratense]|uniref:Uncharacterized protein n=1 Tax=Trifolium pratense TaxID=57577 RepID=A0A2K3MDC9_TRIPR|nr:hypothetical protein L195_g035372 [Trifolium pratense]PNX88795.1 hypothetical protein L195_g044909 [Trifolium pratense]PNX88797.1 hypothetical protein L195_g044911 [Trifolium pratense]